MAKRVPENQLKGTLKTLKLNEDTISTILGGIVVIIVGLLVFNYFKSINEIPGQITDEAIQEDATPGQVNIIEENGVMVPEGLPATYTVTKGDHLWHIAESFYQSGYNWVDIAEANQLTNPSGIEVGQVLTIPKVGVKQATVSQTPAMQAIDAGTYTVQKGDHLWNIAVRAYGDGYRWTEIYNSNRELIGSNPGLIETGQVLNLPR